MKHLLWPFLAVVCAAGLSGCGFEKSKAMAAAGVDTFHQCFNAGKYADIYAAATPAFQAATSQPDFVKMMEGLRRKFGQHMASTQAGWYANAGTAGTLVALKYDSQFERGKARETFTFKIGETGAKLQRYQINSPALLLDSPAAQRE